MALLRRAGLPAPAHHADPGRRAARAPDPRVDRPRRGARPRAGARDLLRGQAASCPRTASASLRIGSELVNVTADATTPGGLGSYRWDDEGVEGRAVPIVREGVLAGFLSSRETAAEIGLERSGGCMRADGFTRQPIVRMTNVNLEPGERRHARGPDRRHRGRPPDRDQPLVVDRRPPPALPVRGRGGLGDPRRRARAACCATRATPGVTPELLGQLRRRLLARGLAPHRRCSTAARASRAR